MKIQRKKISGKAMLLDCFSTPWESTEFLTIYLSNLSNKTTLENCQNIINTNSNKQQGGCVKVTAKAALPSCQEQRLTATPGGSGSMCTGVQDVGPPPCATAPPRVGERQSCSYTGHAPAAA